ncbi:MAG: hypothetical protein WCY01_06285, partial [Alkalispirochaeta sp.]
MGSNPTLSEGAYRRTKYEERADTKKARTAGRSTRNAPIPRRRVPQDEVRGTRRYQEGAYRR